MLRFILVELFVLYILVCTVKAAPEVTLDVRNPSKSQKDSKVQPILGTEESHAGFIRISNHSKNFFWFFKCKNTTAPLIIWLQGQPGLSSLYGLFYESGPYEIDENMSIKRRKYAWTDYYNVLFLDSTVRCGFSHSLRGNLNHNDGDEYSDHLHEDLHDVIIQFFAVFPQFLRNEVYLVGASTSSKILPMLARCILFRNENFGYEVIKLKGLIIGGGLLFDDYNLQYARNLFRLGILDLYAATTMNRPQHIISALSRSQNVEGVMEFIGTQLTLQIQKVGFKSIYDIRQVDSVYNSKLHLLMSKNSFRDRIHVGTRLFQNRRQVIIAYILHPFSEVLSNVLKKTRILLYNAQFDLSASYNKALSYLSHLHWHGAQEFQDKPKNKWVLNDELLGHWKSAQNLTHVFIRNAGHMVGITQPLALLDMVQNFINGNF